MVARKTIRWPVFESKIGDKLFKANRIFKNRGWAVSFASNDFWEKGFVNRKDHKSCKNDPNDEGETFFSFVFSHEKVGSKKGKEDDVMNPVDTVIR